MTDTASKAEIAEFDLELFRLVKRMLAAGVPRKAVMTLLIDQAHGAMQAGPGDGRRSAEAVLQEALHLHSLFDDPEKAS